MARGATAATLALAVALALALAATRVAAERHVAAGSGHVCVLGAANNVTCSRDTDFVSNFNKTVVPVGIPFIAVTAGDTFSCGLTSNGSAACWGEFPGAAPNPATTFLDIHAGANNLCGVQAAGIVLCYGNASTGITTVPAGVYQGVSTGTDVACAVARNHTVTCWGNATNPVITALPPSITDADHVSVGARHACYITTAGGLACWGDNTFGQASVPAGINAMSAVWWVSAGGRLTCAISGSSAANMVPPGRLTCWGESTINNMNAYEVACATWGCIVAQDAGGGAATTSYVATSMASVPVQRTYNATTYVGDGSSGYINGIGTNARFANPMGLAMFGGVLAVAEYGNQVIRRVNLTTASVTILAGMRGLSGRADSANPLAATFTFPTGVDYDAAGNLYVLDSGNSRIRKITPAGNVTTLAANVVMNTIYGLQYDDTSGVVYFTDYELYGSRNLVRALYPNGTVGIIADFGCCSPSSIALDSDRAAHHVRWHA